MCSSFPGVRVRWGVTTHTVSEDSGTVHLVLLKEGFTVSNVSVKIITVACSAIGKSGQACQTGSEIYISVTCYTLFSASEDYEAIASNITFSPVQTSAMVSVTIVDDDLLEDVEQFTVEVVATGGQERVDVGDAANISISNDDCEITFVSKPSNISSYTCMSVHHSVLLTHMSVCMYVWGYVSLFFSLSVFLSFYLSVYLLVFVSLCVSAYVYVCQSVCLSACLPTCLRGYILLCTLLGHTLACLFVCLSVFMSVGLSVSWSVCLSVSKAGSLALCLFLCMYVCLSICLSPCLSACLSLCLSVHPPLHTYCLFLPYSCDCRFLLGHLLCL